jgi:hypothetical protein
MDDVHNSDNLLPVNDCLDLIIKLRSVKGSELSPEEEMLLRVAENEYLSKINGRKSTQEQINRFFENILYLRIDINIGLQPRNDRDLTNNDMKAVQICSDSPRSIPVFLSFGDTLRHHWYGNL